MRQVIKLCLVLALLNSLACGSRDSRLLGNVEVKGVAPLGGDLAYVQSNGVVQRLNVMGANPQPITTKVAITSNPRLILKRPHDATSSPVDELLVVSDGQSDQYGQVIEKPALTALTAQGAKREYPLVNPGQQLQVSDDGQFAILFNNPNYIDSTSLLTNPGEVAIITDLSATSDPVIVSLDTVGGPPFAVWFLKLNLATPGNTLESRPFALFAFPQGVSLIDLNNPTDPGLKLPLTGWLPSGGMDINSGFGVVFDPGSTESQAEIYLKNNNSSDIEVLSVTSVTATGDSGTDNPFNVSVRTLTVSNSATPTAFAIYSLTSGTQQLTRLLATVGDSVASVTTDSDVVTSVPLSMPANQILPFDATAPDDPTVRHRALLYQSDPTGANLETGVTFVDLEDLETSKTEALQAVDFGAKISSVLQLPQMSSQLLIILSGGGIDILDLATRHWSPINSNVPITLMVADSMRNRLWVSGAGDNRIGYVDLGTIDATQPTLTIDKSTQLDDPVQYIFRLDNSGISRAIVTHDQAGGAVTLLDATTPARSTARKLEGFLLSDLL